MISLGASGEPKFRQGHVIVGYAKQCSYRKPRTKKKIQIKTHCGSLLGIFPSVRVSHKSIKAVSNSGQENEPEASNTKPRGYKEHNHPFI